MNKMSEIKENKKIAVIGLSGQSVFIRTDHFHQPEETIIASSIYEEVGGKGFNQAVAIKRLGGNPYFIGSIGRDYNGKKCEECILNEDIEYTFFKKESQTAFATILRDKNGENQVTVYQGASMELNAEDFEEFKQCLLDASFIMLQLETPLEIIKKVVKLAKENNIKVILNPAPASKNVKEIYNDVWLLTPNFQEMKVIFSLDENLGVEDAVKMLPDLGNKKMIITLGAKGVCIIENGNVEFIKAFDFKAKDTTGAGDIFNGALAVKLCEGASLKEASIFAMAAAGISVTRNYVIASIPTRQEVDEYLNSVNK